MSSGKRNRRRSWPAWLAPLRPDDVSRARMRAAIEERAEAWLEGRRAGSVWDVAEEAARRLAPLAAAAVLLFGWMAHRAERETLAVGSGVAVEEPVRPAGDGPLPARSDVAVEELLRATRGPAAGPPAMLTAASAPSQDLVLEATLRGED